MLVGVLLILASCNQSANITESTIKETVEGLEEKVEKSNDFNGNQMVGMKNGEDMHNSFLDDEEKEKLTRVYNEVSNREKEGMSQADLAEKANIKQSQLARFERATHSPQINSLLRVLYPLGYTIKLEKIKH